MLQYYSALPFNVVSGINSLQGTAGRPLADGSVSTPSFDVRAVEFIPRNSVSAAAAENSDATSKWAADSSKASRSNRSVSRDCPWRLSSR